jgi:hypothetical protein
MDDVLPQRSRMLLTGDFEHPDFALVRTWLPAHATTETGGPSAISTGNYDLVAVCQSRPGQYSQLQVESIHRAAPLAALLAILGSWCEGESRSGRPWHGIERVYWYDAIGRFNNLVGRTREGSYRTEAPMELIQRQALSPTHARYKLAAIFTPHRADFEALADACQARSIAAHWLRTCQPSPDIAPDLVLISADDFASAGSQADLANLRRTWSAARFIGLLNFPRRDDIAALQAAGCDAVIGKPFLVSDLFSA